MAPAPEDSKSIERPESSPGVSRSDEDGDDGNSVALPTDDEFELSLPDQARSDHMETFGDLTGQVVGHYKIEEKLGGGAMASVYRAHDQILEKPVALKVLMPGADGVTRERFRREARTVATLKHDHIVHTDQVGQTSANGIIYIAMELVTGDSLADLLERQGRLNAQDSCRILEPIGRALAYAHERGVIHRDVKPSNILLRQVEAGAPGSMFVSALDFPVVPLLSDFGIARALDSPDLTSAGRTIGTPAFMSPEQCAGNSEIDGRADIYSLGAVLYRCVVGRTPFVGTTTQILHAHVYDPLLIPDDMAAQLPAVVIDMLGRSLMKVPDARYPSADLMAEDLATGAGSQPTTYARADDQTQTMVSLPVPDANRAPSASQVLVPAGGTAQSGSALQPETPGRKASSTRKKKSPAPATWSVRTGGNRSGIMILGGALAILVAILLITAINTVAPSRLANSTPTMVAGTPTVRMVVQVTPSPASSLTDDPTPKPTLNAPSETPIPGGVLPVAEDPDPTPTPTVMPPLQASLEDAWDRAQAFYEEGDWQEALTWLIAVQRIDREFEPDRINEMLVESRLGVSALASAEGDFAKALAHLDSVLEVAEDVQPLWTLRQATAEYAEADEEGKDSARRAVQVAYSTYAADLAAADRFCAAQDQVANAIRILADVDLLDVQAEYRRACEDAIAEQALGELTGSLVYSAERDGMYQILRLSPGLETSSTLLIENGAQPAVRPDGRLVAFYSLRPDSQGLSGYDLYADLDPNDRSLRYTDFVEDARDSPPSWNPQGDRLVYASTNFGDGRSRIYLTWADGSRGTTTLGLGKDPAWHPSRDLIVYNGADEAGNGPGLWLANVDGSGRRQLTDNGNDQRPAWTPDGRHVIFMSNGRDGNWELYSVDVETQSVVRLTNHIAQDGLPSVSPDGRHVAFMSDRDGYWRVWYVPVDGGTVRPLAPIEGVMRKWLEHTIQWVE